MEVTDTGRWSLFILGIGGLVAVALMHRFGRLPVLFYTQLIALGFLVGCVFAPNFRTFAAMRMASSFFSTAPQVTGLYVVTDLYPFHLQARKVRANTTITKVVASDLKISAQYLGPGLHIVSLYPAVCVGLHGTSGRARTTILKFIHASYINLRFRWAYGVGCLYNATVIVLISLFGKETSVHPF